MSISDLDGLVEVKLLQRDVDSLKAMKIANRVMASFMGEREKVKIAKERKEFDDLWESNSNAYHRIP